VSKVDVADFELGVEITVGSEISMVDICSDDKSDEDKVLVELETKLVVVISISVTDAALVSDND